MEVERKVQTYQITLKCPDCEFQMKKIDHLHNTYQCNRCHFMYVTDKVYPYYEYIPKN